MLANNGSGEPGCSKNIGSCLVTRVVDSKPTTVSTYAVTYSPASTVGPQAVTSTVGVLDANPRLSIGAKEFLPKQRVLFSCEEAPSTSRRSSNAFISKAGTQRLCLGSGSHSIDETHDVSTMKSNSVVFETIQGLSSAIREGIALPKRNIPNFNGDPLHYYGFIKRFEETVMKQVSNPASQLAYLIDMCQDKAHEAVKSCNIISPPAETLQRALDKLACKFRKRHVVVKAHLDCITKGPSVKADKDSLENLARDMFNCHTTLVQWAYDSGLNSSQTLLDVFKRLPIHLQRKFSDRVDVNQSVTQVHFRSCCLSLKKLQIALIRCLAKL